MIQFPSPFRGSYFSILKTFYLPVILMPCFRPLSGDLISQLKYNKLVTQRSLVSVPFPGILFLNDSKWVFDESTTVWFPSTSRGSYFSIFLILSFLCSAHTAFPSPSRGSYFSMLNKIYEIMCLPKVSVPFPGILFLNERRFL